MTVDLNTCVPGQQCIAGDGRCLTYVRKINNALHYPHLLLDQDSSEETFTNDGTYDIRNFNGKYNIVRIIPMESTKSDKHPSVAWWESCPWITDRTPTKEDGDHLGQVIQQVSSKTGTTLDLCFISWAYVKEGQSWIHSLNWKPPTLTDKEKAIELIDKHKEGWTPTLDEWLIISNALKE